MDLVGHCVVKHLKDGCKIRRQAHKGSKSHYAVFSSCNQKSPLTPAAVAEGIRSSSSQIDPDVVICEEAERGQGESQVKPIYIQFDNKLLTKYIMNEAYERMYRIKEWYDGSRRSCIIHVLFREKLDSLFYHRALFLLKYLTNTLTQNNRNLVMQSDVVSSLLSQDTSVLQQTQCSESIQEKTTLLRSDTIHQLNTHNNIITEDGEKLICTLCSPVTIEGNKLSDIRIIKGSDLYKEFIYTTQLVLHNLRQPNNGQSIKLYLISPRTCSYKVNIIKTVLQTIFSSSKVDVEILSVYPVELPDLTTTDLVQIKRGSLEEASKHRLSASQIQSLQDSEVQEKWKRRIDTLTTSCLSMDFLRSTSDQSIAIRREQAGGRDSSFIMYNCARISTLLQSFNEKVEEDYYGMLPRFKDVDLSLLKTQEEWCLIFNHINSFPILLSSIREDFISTSHRLISFLHDLSRDFSSYYSRTYILTENQPHLLPQMYSRIWLVKLIHRIYITSFNLIGIEAQQTMILSMVVKI